MTKPRIRVKAISRPFLNVVPIAWPVDADVTTLIGSIEERAKSGRLVSLAVAGVHRDGAISTAFVRGPEVFALMGALRHLERRVAATVEIA